MPGHHVPLPVQPDAGVPRRAHVPHAHAHRQGDAELGQLQQVSPRHRLPSHSSFYSFADVGAYVRRVTEEHPGNRPAVFDAGL